jgi:cyclopropane-fatty-acyl-phospholipid synthase
MLLFVPFLRRLLQFGRLTVIDAAGRSHVFSGQPLPDVQPVTVRLRDRRLHWLLPLKPSLAVGEAYMDGTLTIEEGSLYDFLAIAAENIWHGNAGFALRRSLSLLVRRLRQWNPIQTSQRNAAHHYDISEDLYNLFLDADRQYSCAYFADPSMSLEEAQCAKKRHIMSKLLLEPGQQVLDIGCGWGGLALSIAAATGANVTGITLSKQQLKVAQRRAEEAQLAHRVRFLYADYREIPGQFDRIVSVGMFEHVGVDHYARFFHRIRQLLTDSGVALIHAIGRSDGPDETNRWIHKYIFPGGYCPALSEVLPPIEKSGLNVTDIEILRPHYADTLRHWRTRFAERRSQAAALYDERFCRMWEFYLAGAEAAFRHQGHMVWQVQLARRIDTVPPTRDYIGTAEQSYPRN